MCFRPPVAEEGMLCPLCGKKINSVLGAMPHECPWCEEDITDAVLAFQEGQAAAPEAPGAPTVPGATTVPGAPDAPAVPAPPQ